VSGVKEKPSEASVTFNITARYDGSTWRLRLKREG